MSQQTVHSVDAELIATVNAHLRQLELSSQHMADEASLRAATGSLRFLLPDGNLARAWRASGIGGPMSFRAWCIDSTGPGDVVALCGGGDILPGIPISACNGATLKEKSLDLAAFRTSARVQIGSTKISTDELIQYVANARGGSHFDPAGKASKKPKAELLARLESGAIQSPPMRINDRSLLHHEILSIVQVVLRSAQVGQLRAWRMPSR